MYYLIKINAMISSRVVLSAFMGLFVLACFAQPAAPQVSIEMVIIDGVDHVKLNWEEVEGAEAYNIYYSTDPYSVNWGEPLATVGDSVFTYTTEDTIDELGRAYYFYVTAYAEAGIPDWLVLVDGDLFYGNVTIDPFYISKYQVTQADFVDVMGAWDFRFPNNPTHPADQVSWFDAVEYCNRLSIREGLTPAYTYNGRLNPDDWYEQWPGWNTNRANHNNVSCNWEANGYRLPTEAEWHHAANAGMHEGPYRYSGSNNIDEVAWYRHNSDIGDGLGRRTHPVGTKLPNGLGIYDMSGNVWELCWDIYGDAFPSGGDNPRGADDGAVRVMRGGSWFYTAACAVTNRHFCEVPNRLRDVGFRVSRSIP